MKCVLLCMVVLWAWGAGAATYLAASASTADVQAAAALTVNGDTIQVPGQSSHWITNVFFTNAITVEFLPGNSIIDDVPTSSTMHIIVWSTVDQGLTRLTGLNLIGGTNSTDSNLPGSIVISGTCKTFRMDHCTLTLLHNTFAWFHGWVYGVYDHNTNFMNFKQAIAIWHDTYGGNSFGDGSWADDDLMGTTNALYIEDCAFTEVSTATAGAIDLLAGARAVTRHSVFTNCTPSTHGTESTGRERSVRLWENYYITQVCTNSGDSTSTGTYRGGTGVQFSNTYIGPYSGIVAMSDYREIYKFTYWYTANGTNAFDNNDGTIFASGTHTGANGSTILIDGAQAWTVNQWKGAYMLWNVTSGYASVITSNNATTVVYRLDGSSVTGGPNITFNTGDAYQIRKVNFSLDQPGRGKGLLLTSGTSPVATNLNQTLSPIYAWNNTINGATVGMAPSGTYPTIVQNTDYYNGMIKPGYQPFVYPHPLVNGSPLPPPPGTPGVAHVTNLRVGKTYVHQ